MSLFELVLSIIVFIFIIVAYKVLIFSNNSESKLDLIKNQFSNRQHFLINLPKFTLRRLLFGLKESPFFIGYFTHSKNVNRLRTAVLGFGLILLTTLGVLSFFDQDIVYYIFTLLYPLAIAVIIVLIIRFLIICLDECNVVVRYLLEYAKFKPKDQEYTTFLETFSTKFYKQSTVWNKVMKLYNDVVESSLLAWFLVTLVLTILIINYIFNKTQIDDATSVSYLLKYAGQSGLLIIVFLLGLMILFYFYQKCIHSIKTVDYELNAMLKYISFEKLLYPYQFKYILLPIILMFIISVIITIIYLQFNPDSASDKQLDEENTDSFQVLTLMFKKLSITLSVFMMIMIYIINQVR